ncbi:hypothetical protein KM043_000403 [Ampulex compressa]|nr:hypothetical protein KM043_000403 [Ampulex compressa]
MDKNKAVSSVFSAKPIAIERLSQGIRCCTLVNSVSYGVSRSVLVKVSPIVVPVYSRNSHRRVGPTKLSVQAE